jgi:hypothetical protein
MREADNASDGRDEDREGQWQEASAVIANHEAAGYELLSTSSSTLGKQVLVFRRSARRDPSEAPPRPDR